MTSRDDVIAELSRELGSEVYVLAPDGSRYFFGEAAMVGVAVSLVAAFVKGLLSGAEDQLESWGKSCGDWLAGRVASVASEGKPDADAQQELAIDAHKATARDAAQYRDAVILVLGHVLYERGMTQDEAALTTQRVAAAADAVLMAASPA